MRNFAQPFTGNSNHQEDKIMTVTESTLQVLGNIETALEPYVKPNPLLVIPPILGAPTQAHIDQWMAAPPSGNVRLGDIGSLLEKLYEVEFIRTVGHSIGIVLIEVGEILVQIADKLGAITISGDALEALQEILAALAKLPVNPEALATANVFLAQMIDLLHDIPSARAELYMIAQQIKTIAEIFKP